MHTRGILAGAVGGGEVSGGRFVNRPYGYAVSPGDRVGCALQHASTPTERRYPERDVEGAVPYKGAVEMV